MMAYLDSSTETKAAELATALDESLNNRTIQVCVHGRGDVTICSSKIYRSVRDNWLWVCPIIYFSFRTAVRRFWGIFCLSYNKLCEKTYFTDEYYKSSHLTHCKNMHISLNVKLHLLSKLFMLLLVDQVYIKVDSENNPLNKKHNL